MRSLLIALVILAAGNSTQAADLFVNPDGTGTYPTIQAAVDGANTGDTIYLMPGTFTGPGNRDVESDFALTITSSDIGNPAVIDCQGSAANPHRAFIIYADAPILEYLIIRNGYSTFGGAVMADGGAPVLNYCQFENNTAAQNGGAVAADGADMVTANHCVFAANTAGVNGGAVYAGSDLEVRLFNCTLFRNSAPHGSGVFYTGNAFLRLNSSIVAFGISGSGIEDYYGAGLVIGCTDMYANQGGDWIGSLAGLLPLNNNISVDPIFCDPMGSPANYSLMVDSPVGNAYACNYLGAKLPDPTWPAPVYGVEANGNGMYPTIQATVNAVPQTAVIMLEDGIYTGDGNRDISFGGKLLRVEGRSGDATAAVIFTEGSNADPHRAFDLDQGEPEGTTLANLTIRGGFIAGWGSPLGDSGGGVRMQAGASLQVLSCRFEDNYNSDGNGHFDGVAGAIHNWFGGSLSVVDCTFTGNQGAQCVRADASGTLDVINCQFLGNLGGVRGRNLNSPTNIEGCLFDDCTYDAVFFDYCPGALQITNCEFLGWDLWPLSMEGGVIVVGDCPSVAIDGCQIRDQWSTSEYTHPVFLTVNSNVALSNTTVVDNRYAILEIRGGTFHVSSCTFSNNSSLDFQVMDDRQVFVISSQAEASFTDCVMDFNQDLVGGPVGWFTSSTVSFLRTSFSNNTTSQGVETFRAENCNLTVDNCNFEGNSGGLMHHGSSLDGVTIKGSSFSSHIGGAAVAVDSMLTGPVLLDNCTFSGNSQGLRLFQVPNFRVAHSTFSDQADSGAVEIRFASGAIDTCSFDRNTSGNMGGALILGNADVGVKDCTFADNTAANYGGAVHFNTGYVSLTRCSFDRNHSRVGGGYFGTLGTIILNHCDFTANVASLNGGGIYTSNSETSLNFCNLIDNVAAFDGGGATHRFSGSTTYTFGRVEGNQASTGGGISTNSGTLSFNDLTIAGNWAAFGGAAHFLNSQTTFNDCTLTGNTGLNNGGLEFDQQSGATSSAQVNGTIIANNTTTMNGGGGITATSGAPVTLQGCTIAGNGGEGSEGQVLCEQGSAASLNNCIIAFGGNGPAAAFGGSGNTISAQGCDVFGNAGGDWVGALAGLNGAACNFSLDPMFCDAPAGDYHFASLSPCLAANNSCGQDVGALGQGCTNVSPVPDDQQELPRTFAVLGNAPNPFNPQTDISFELPTTGPVTVEIYDVTGRLVRRLISGESYPAGSHQVTWDGRDDGGQAQSSGVYLYRVTAEGTTLGGKMAMIR